MKECLYCAEPIPAGAIVCNRCSQPQLPAHRYNAVISMSLLGLAGAAALAYWSLSVLVWLPVARSVFYVAAEGLGIQYTLAELPSQSLLNAPWLMAGAFLYLPVVTGLITRFGFRRAVVSALLAPAPFAFMDAWTWSAAEPPGFLQFIPVLIVAASLIVLLHALFLFLAPRWPARATLIEARSLRPSAKFAPSPAAIAEPKPHPKPISEPPAEIPKPRSHPQPVSNLPPARLAVLEPGPELVASAGVKESAPPPFVVEADGTERERVGGVPAWLIVAGLAVIITVGVIFIVYALQA